MTTDEFKKRQYAANERDFAVLVRVAAAGALGITVIWIVTIIELVPWAKVANFLQQI